MPCLNQAPRSVRRCMRGRAYPLRSELGCHQGSLAGWGCPCLFHLPERRGLLQGCSQLRNLAPQCDNFCIACLQLALQLSHCFSMCTLLVQKLRIELPCLLPSPSITEQRTPASDRKSTRLNSSH